MERKIIQQKISQSSFQLCQMTDSLEIHFCKPLAIPSEQYLTAPGTQFQGSTPCTLSVSSKSSHLNVSRQVVALTPDLQLLS